MNKIIKRTNLQLVLLLIVVFSSNFILPACSKDESLLTQEDLVKISNEYKETVENIAKSENLINQLKEKLETADEEEKPVIQAQIDRESESLQQLQEQKIELEKKLGLI